MKKLFLILALAALMTGCTSQPAATENTTEVPAETQSGELPVDPSWEIDIPDPTRETMELTYSAYQVVYNITTDGGQETGVFQGIDPDGNLVWTYETQSYAQAQLSSVLPLGQYQGTYYLLEGGTIVALDITSGKVLFENTDFGGSPAKEAIVIDDYGYLYLAGYDGPDFFAMDPEGHTVKQISHLDPDYCMPFKIEIDGDQLTVYMESDGKGSSGTFPVSMHMDWLPKAKG